MLCLENMGRDKLTTVKETIVEFILAQSHWLLLIVGTGKTTPDRDPALQLVNAPYWVRETPAKF